MCGRCARTFTVTNLRELTAHRHHSHDNNPLDGSNRELLCVYCHDNEHQRQAELHGGMDAQGGSTSTETDLPFANLKAILGDKKA